MVSVARSPLAGVPHCFLLACILLLSASSAFASTDCPTGSYREADLTDVTKYPIYPPPSTGNATLRSSIGDANPANYTLECSGSYCVRINLDAVTYTMPDFYRTQSAMSSWTPYYSTSPYASSYDPTTKDWASVVSVCKALFQYEKRYASFYTRSAFHDSLSVDPSVCASAGNSNCGGADASLFLSLDELTNPANVGHDFAALTKITVAKIASWFQVSYADVLAVCGAVGPSVMNNGASSVIIGLNNQANFPVGRIDSDVETPPGNLVFPNADVATWVAYFKARGFSMDEAAALMGSHTSIQTQGCYEGVQHGGLYCQPASTNCNDKIQALRWDNHYYQDTCTPAVTVTIDDSASATSSAAITDTINQGLCAYTSDQFKNLAVWQVGRDIANSINTPTIALPIPPVAAATNATATGAAAAAAAAGTLGTQVATWDSYYCGASVFPGSYNTPSGTATVSQAAYLSNGYSSSCSCDASYKTGLPNGNNIFSKILGTESTGKNPADYTISTYTNCPHTSQWGYTINDAFLSQVCLGDVPSEVSAYDASAIKNAYKTYAMNRAQWNSAYASAYIKMVSTFAKFVDDVYPNKKRFYIDGTECPSGYVVKPMYKKSVDYAMKKLSCSTWAGSNNGYNGNKGNMNTPPYPDYCMCKTAFVNVADRFGFTSRVDGLPIDVSTLPSLTVAPANTAPITLSATGSPTIEYPTSAVTIDTSSCVNGVCSPSDLVSATSGP